MRRPFALLLFCFLIPIQLCAATRIDLNENWRFRTDPKQEGQSAGWSGKEPGGTEAVSIPHTWGIGKHADYEGVGWYFRTFEGPVVAGGAHVELHFGATFDHARVFLNGVELGRHEGGFTEYFFDVTAHLRSNNYLAVELDNRPSSKSIPGVGLEAPRAWYDWWHWGGIVRNVWLTESQSTFVRSQQIRSVITGDRAVVQDRVSVDNSTGKPQRLVLQAKAFDADGNQAAVVNKAVTLAPGASSEVLSLDIAHAQLWSLDHPAVYRMDVEVADEGGKLFDTHTDSFGIRSVEIRDRHLLLNGERVRLTGIARHEDSPWEGLAETRGTILRDYDDMKALHITLTRPVHYTQNPAIFDYADRHGILLIPEIPVWQFDEHRLADPEVLKLALQQMKEMIEQAGNHPSIFAWSVANESAMATPEGKAYFRELRKMIRERDPQRFVTFADNHLSQITRREDTPAADADFIMMNEYFGSWHGRKEELSSVLDRIGRIFPDKMLIISEFGTPGIFGEDSVAADKIRVSTMREQMQEFARRDWIGGAIFWCYQDYMSHRNLWPGTTAGYVDHGVVDENRQRRPSYDAWQNLNTPARIDASWKGQDSEVAPNSLDMTVIPNPSDSIPSYPLHDYSLVWRVQDSNGVLIASGEHRFPELNETATVQASFSSIPRGNNLRLTLTLLQPTGAIAAQKVLTWHRPLQGAQMEGAPSNSF